MFDPECYKLAEYFLSREASGRLKDELAQEIQDTIEDWLTSERNRLTLQASGYFD